MNEELNGSIDEDDFEVYMPQWRPQEVHEIPQIEDPEIQRLRLIERHNQLVRLMHGRGHEQRDEERDQHPREEPYHHDHGEFQQNHENDLDQYSL